jgi:mevalonate kinase
MQFKASAPGSLMLLGEYAVLYGKYALVCALDKRITVTLTPRSDNRIEIQSDLHGFYHTTLSELTVEKPFHFVLGVLKHYQARLKYGCDIQIETEFSDKIGFGSSAAVVVATFSTLIAWLNIRISTLELLRQGRNIVRAVQGVGSGADIAASVHGGVVGYQAQPLFAEKFSVMPQLNALYVGFKTPTVDAIKRVENQFADHPHLFKHINNSIGQCAIEAMQCLRKENWTKIGKLMNIQQGMLEALGVSLPLVQNVIESLRLQPGILGAKISGSGLGDCIIGLGELADDYQFIDENAKVKRIPVQMTLQGVQCEKI